MHLNQVGFQHIVFAVQFPILQYSAMIVDFWKTGKLSNGDSNLQWNLVDRAFLLWHEMESEDNP